MLNKLTLGLTASVLAVSSVNIAYAMESGSPAATAELVKQVDIPYEKFQLENGLTVLVHEDNKAPIVAVSIWYDVGSKHEPKGKTGYAHLFEHIMFNGSENAPGDYFQYTKKIGATDLNGTTWLDRTNYFQTVPKTALESALFLESDRMGHLLNAIDQEKLDNQIGVVQNEKRQRDNQPYGLVSYAQVEALFPKGHPYGHSTIGSLDDLSAASLDDMKQWFIDHYGPNNAVLVLAGDINTKDAKSLVKKWFGDIKRGKDVKPVNAPIPTLDAPKMITLKDKVPATRIYRSWVVAGRYDEDFVPLSIGASVLGGLSSSRLDNKLVREEQSAVSVSSYVTPFVNGSLFNIQADVKPGVDANIVGKRLDEIFAEYIKSGPTKDEVQRVVSSRLGGEISGLEQVGGFGGKATALARGELYKNDAAIYKKQLQQMAATTPANVQKAMESWLTRPVVEIRVEPGERESYKEVADGEAASITNDRNTSLHAPAYYRHPDSDKHMDAAHNMLAFDGDRSKFPEASGVIDLDFPTVKETTLDNGIKLFFAKRDAVPVVRVSFSFDAGTAADLPNKRGIASMMGAMMDEGTNSLNSVQLAEQQERLGASVSVGSSLDRTSVSLRALKTNLSPSLDLLADVIKNPSFDAKELERVRVQQLTSIKGENSQPQGIAFRSLPPLVYGKQHPYGGPLTGSGDAEVVQSLTRDDLVAFHGSYVHPEKAEIFVVGDTDLKTIKAELNARFGNWKPSTTAGASKNFDVALPEKNSRIILIDRPNSPQSLIIGGLVMDAKGTDDNLTLRAANEVLGGGFLSRINYDLRETKGWSYGSRSIIVGSEDKQPFVVFSPVQTNQTGPSLEAIIGHIDDFNGDKGVTEEELNRTVTGNTLELPGNYERSTSVLGQMQSDRLSKRDFDYAETIADKYRALTPKGMNDAMRKYVKADQIVWLVVGDASIVKPQLEKLGLPIEMPTNNATDGNDSAK